MIFVYRRRIEPYDEQIGQVQTNTEELVVQIQKYEEDHGERKEELESLRSQVDEIAAKEKEVGEKINALKQATPGRRPTRFRVDTGGSGDG